MSLVALCVALIVASRGRAAELPQVTDVAVQPLRVQVSRVVETLDQLGAPLDAAARAKIDDAAKSTDDAEARKLIQQALDPLCLMGVMISPESRVKVAPGPAADGLVTLDQGGWRTFLIKVHNTAGVTAPLRANSPQAQPLRNAPADQVADRWMDLDVFTGRPLSPQLSGLELEYRVIQVYSRDAGKRSAVIALDVGQGTQDLGFRNDVTIHFDARAAQPTTFRVLDEHGKPTTASFVIRDAQGHVYPAQSKRLEPDFAFQPQIYRADGETVLLPTGEYTAEVSRGPEYLTQTRKFFAGSKREAVVFELERWVDPSLRGWWSGDHHIHAAGCAHYQQPTEGVAPAAMMRHCLGEDLKIGANLTWGPCFDYQKQFFTGHVDKVSQWPYLLRYDIEVSGFGSHRAGHLCLLRLKDQIYPGGDSKNHWPTLCLNTLKWAKAQGAVVGPAHSGWGLAVPGDTLPIYADPPFNGIGANEYIVDVTHELPGPDGKLQPAVDFMSMCDTPYTWELNMWYHTLNAGFRTRISGETDFPCIYGERVGLGRAYVKLDGKLNYDDWCEGIRNGRAYVSDGRSHLMDMRVNNQLDLGTHGSELRLDHPDVINVMATVCALLPERPNPDLSHTPINQKPYWHLERARIEDSRDVWVELVINGKAVDATRFKADGVERDIEFNTRIDRSSWVALRILGSIHTNPVFILVNDKPIRASKQSAEWCLRGVEKCWREKKKFYDADEMDDAIKAYDHARAVYRKIIEESDVE
ncbi:MAG: hypothetical protein GC159_17925 [Phycisphaera sp.]|nr:hypothetical protein [Phycisphaera sp.]